MTVTDDGYAEPPGAASIEARLKAARAHAAASLAEGKSGFELAETLTAEVEAVLSELARAQFARAGVGEGSGIAVLATGGFGRREFAPHSDLDLIFLCEREPDGAVEALAQSVLHPLWDARLDAGHAVRSQAEALELPKTDLTAATALLDARFLVGDQAMADRFLALFGGRVAGAAPDSFVARLRAEQRTRHSKFGDTIFLLQPDLKSGPGGLRDLCAGRWAALARFGTGMPAALRDLGEMSARQAASFEAARDWFLRVRVALHLAAGRRQDQLRFDYQEKIAPVLYPDAKGVAGDARSDVAPAVEALMFDFQRHAKAVSRETERLMLRASADPNHRPRRVPVALGAAAEMDPAFELQDGVLEVKDPEIFERQPSEMFRLFSAAIELDLPVGLRTSDLVAEHAAHRGEALRADPDAARRFLDVLTDVRDRTTPSRLEQMNDLGLLTALIPEWEPARGRVQHDVYHVYTVDQHSLYAVAMLKALVRKEHIDDYPAYTEEAQHLERPLVLYLTLLLHDIGKPIGKNHSARGAEVAAQVAERLGLAAEDVEQIELLVREHLTMAHTSQRRDLDDPALIARFAELTRDEEGLRQLFLLSFCDITCVGPETFTKWKDELLRDLFQRARVYLRRGPDLLMEERAELARRRKKQALAAFGEGPTVELRAIFDSLPDRYFTENSVRRISSHVGLIRDRAAACAMQITHQIRKGYSELVVVADDVPGLLAKIAGVLFANRIDIMDATIYSREPAAGPDGSGKGEALDVFRIRKAYEGAVTDEAKIASIEKDLLAVLEGRLTVEALVASRPANSSLFGPSKPEVPPTEVKIDNEVSRDFTVVDVFTEDRPGVLYTIAHTLHEQGLDIHRSKVGVEADRVADVFYVRDKASGVKILDPDRVEEIRAALVAALPSGKKA